MPARCSVTFSNTQDTPICATRRACEACCVGPRRARGPGARGPVTEWMVPQTRRPGAGLPRPPGHHPEPPPLSSWQRPDALTALARRHRRGSPCARHPPTRQPDDATPSPAAWQSRRRRPGGSCTIWMLRRLGRPDPCSSGHYRPTADTGATPAGVRNQVDSRHSLRQRVTYTVPGIRVPGIRGIRQVLIAPVGGGGQAEWRMGCQHTVVAVAV